MLRCYMPHPPVMTNIAIEHGHGHDVSLTMNSMVIYVLNYQTKVIGASFELQSLNVDIHHPPMNLELWPCPRGHG